MVSSTSGFISKAEGDATNNPGREGTSRKALIAPALLPLPVPCGVDALLSHRVCSDTESFLITTNHLVSGSEPRHFIFLI